jgi:PIN domain nuclease of toxin-antitoxin system
MASFLCPSRPSTAKRRDNWTGHIRTRFDRLLVVQALDERLVLVHADSQIRAYEPVSQLWARGWAPESAER